MLQRTASVIGSRMQMSLPCLRQSLHITYVEESARWMGSIEGREILSDGGEKDKDNPTTNQTKPTTAHRPRLHHQVVFPLHQGETSETMTADNLWA